MTTLEITQDTFLKQSTAQASALDEGNKYAVAKGMKISLAKHEPIDELSASDSDGHVKLVLIQPIKGKVTWYAFQRHVAILDGDKLLFPAPEEDDIKQPVSSTPVYKGLPIKLKSKTVYTDQPILPGGGFSWGEATHGGTRIPDLKAEENIINLAKQLQKVREEFGKPVRVTSWYRPEPFNSRVGGAKQSQHLSGKAVDIVIEGSSGRDIARRVLPWWPGGVGIYPGNRRHICHLDIGPKRNWGI